MDVWHNPSEQLRDRKRLNVTHKEAVAKAEAVLERRAASSIFFHPPQLRRLPV